MKVRIRLTPTGHYFFGGERGFGYDKQLKRQMSDSYFIRSLDVPSQTTLFGVLRYILGVKDGRLRENAERLIGKQSYSLLDENEDFGIIRSISPVYLSKQDYYYIRTPFDHKNGSVYNPLSRSPGVQVDVINYPCREIRKVYPSDYNAKAGLPSSFMSLSEKKIVEDNEIFRSSVEVVSRKNKDASGNEDGFAKKEYKRLAQGWSFVFFAELDAISIPDYNRSAVLGKDSSVFTVDMVEGEEPNVASLFKDREFGFLYFQSPAYISGGAKALIEASDFSILGSESLRVFKTQDSRLRPDYDAPLIQLVSAGSIAFSKTKECVLNTHAQIAGFNRTIGGKEI